MKRRLALLLSPVLAVGAVLGAVAPARAQTEPPAVLQGRPDAEPSDAGAGAEDTPLGNVFESLSAGIAFRPPAGWREQRGGGGDEVVQFAAPNRNWTLRISRVQFGQPLTLETQTDPKSRKPIPGLLDLTVEQLKLDQPGAEMLREDVVPMNGTSAALIAARYRVGLETFLHQQALVRQSDRTYAIFTLTTPAPRTGDVAQDPGVREAVATFNGVLDTVRLIDQSEIRREQNERLFRTRALFVNITEPRLRNALIYEQWLRLIKDGKDVGYAYVVEEVASDLPKKNAPPRPGAAAQGLRIGMRSRTMPGPGVQIDAESWMWMSFDRRHEQWSSAARVRRAGQEESYVSEFGVSDYRERRSLVKDARPGELRPDGSKDVHQPAVDVDEFYVLNVTHVTKTATAEPVTRELPVFYIPQALGHLLPRLLPRFEQKGYMFAGYVSDAREVMARYVDVEREEEVKLGGQAVRAIPILDRIGLEGAVTTHYMSPDGQYLGSVNAETGITYLPTDRATLLKLWQDADLTRPGDVEQKER